LKFTKTFYVVIPDLQFYDTLIFAQNHSWRRVSSYTMINQENLMRRTINSNSDNHVGDGRCTAASDGTRVIGQQTLWWSRREWER